MGEDAGNLIYFIHSSLEVLWIIAYFSILVHRVKSQVNGMKRCISTVRKQES